MYKKKNNFCSLYIDNILDSLVIWIREEFEKKEKTTESVQQTPRYEYVKGKRARNCPFSHLWNVLRTWQTPSVKLLIQSTLKIYQT